MNKLNIFDFEGYQVVKLSEIDKLLSASDYQDFLKFLEGQTLTIDKDYNTLVFYSDLARFLGLIKKPFIFNKIN